MGKLQLLFIVINVVVLTSCTVTKTTNVTTVQKATATANAESSSDDSSASATATAQSTVIKTTTVSKNNSSSENGSTGTTGSNCECDNNKCSGALQRAKRAIIKFSFRCLYEVIQSNKNDTKIASPLTIFYYMAYFILYTYGKTLQELLKFTGLKNEEEAICIMKEINTYSQNQPKGIEYRFGINVVGDDSEQFTEPFKRGLIELVEGRGLNLNLDEPDEVKEMVNKVIAKQTKNRVKNAITTSDIYKKDNYASNLVFASGEFFRGMWQKEFNTKNTTMGNYCDDQNNVLEVPFLNQCGVYNYTECSELGVQVVSIPFVDGYYDNVVFLPRKACELKSLVMKLQDPDIFYTLICNLRPKKVNLHLPVFSNATSEIDDVGILKTMDIDSLFDPKKAEIKNAYGKKTDEYVSGGRQRLIIKNPLSGVEPYTGDECSIDMEDQNEYEFVADHPAVLAIMSHGVPQIVLVGKVIT